MLLAKKVPNDSVLSGFVLLPDENQSKAQGIEVRLVSPTKVTLCSFTTEENGRFQKMIFRSAGVISIFGCGSIAPTQLFFYIKLEGYAELFQPWNKDTGNILSLLRGPSELMDATHRELQPLTPAESFRKELVTEYNELAVRYYEAGLADALKHNTAKAISDLNNAIKAAPDFFEAYLELGSVQQEAKQYEGAEQALRKAIALKPTAAEPVIDLGAVLLDMANALGQGGSTEKAITAYANAAAVLKDAIEKAPWSSDAFYYLGSAQYKLDQLSDAESSLRTALERSNPRQDARLMLVNVYVKQRRYANALEQLDSYLAAVPDSAQRQAAEEMKAKIQAELIKGGPPDPVASVEKLNPALAAVIRRATEYVGKYEANLGNLIGTENYVQSATWQSLSESNDSYTRQGPIQPSVSSTAVKKIDRRMLSDFLLIQVGPQWVPLREVNELNGAKVRNELQSPFDESPANNTKRFNSMKADSTKYNIGDVIREINLPTFALQVLRQNETSRFDFEKNGTEMIDGTMTWRIRFRETRGRALVTTATGKNLYSTGTLWINTETGAVLKTEFIVDNRAATPEIKSKVVVTYVGERNLGFLVPGLMLEHYERGDNIIDCRTLIRISIHLLSTFNSN